VELKNLGDVGNIFWQLVRITILNVFGNRVDFLHSSPLTFPVVLKILLTRGPRAGILLRWLFHHNLLSLDPKLNAAAVKKATVGVEAVAVALDDLRAITLGTSASW